jgi:phosphoglycerol transferase MdoB-like AlkP superfamily enzyme
MKKLIDYLRAPFKDIVFRVFFIVLTLKLLLFTFVNELGAESYFPALGTIMLVLAFSLLISRSSFRIAYLLLFDLLCSLIFISNSLHLNYFGDYATFNNLIQIRQLPAVADMIFKMSHKEFLYMADVLCVPLLFIGTKNNNKISFNSRLRAFIIIFIIGVYLNSNTLVSLVKTNDFDAIFYRQLFVKSLGIFNYQITDAYYYFIKEAGKTPVSEKDLDSINKWLSMKTHERTYRNELTGIGRGMNLIIIQVESLQNFVINNKFYGKEITPNLNALARQGIYFNNIYDQTGYGNSADATLLVNASLYPSRRGAACFLYAQNCFESLPGVLNDLGYSTATFHANVKKFWNSDVFEKSLGFQHQFYKDDYVKVDSLGWGLSDKAFFSQSVEKVNKLQFSFYAFMRTLSTHGPFDQFFADDIDNYPLHELDGKTIGYYLRAMHYVDAAIGSFLSALTENNLLSNTIIVIYGDHRAHISDADLPKIGIFDLNENKKIPLIISIPKRRQGEERHTIGGLIDVAPTIFNIMGIDTSDRYFLGKDLAESKNGFVIFRDGSYFSRDGAINRSTAQKELQLSDDILEKNLIPLLNNRKNCH